MGFSKSIEEKQKQRTYDTEGCYVAHNTVFQFQTEQMRLFEDRRDRNRSESRPCRANRERENEMGRQEKQRKNKKYIQKQVEDMPYLTLGCVLQED